MDEPGDPLGWVVGFWLSFRISLTYLLFQSSPQLGTAATIAVSVALCYLAALRRIRFDRCSAAKSLPPALKMVFAYLGLAGMSLLWSSTASLGSATGYWIGMVADVVTAVLILNRGNSKASIDLFKGFIVGAMFVAGLAWSIPAASDMRLGNEEFLHPNALGFTFAIAALLAMFVAREAPFWKWPTIFLVVTLLRTLSKTSIAAFVAAATFYLLFCAELDWKTKIKLAVISLIICVSFMGLFEAYFDEYTQGTNVETMTGRTVIWAQSFEIALEKPYLGHGFYSYRFVVPPFGEFEAWEAHNELLQQFFAYGVAGIAIFIGLYWSIYRQIRSCAVWKFKGISAAFLVFALVRGVADTERFDLSFPLWVIAVFSLVLAPRVHKYAPMPVAIDSQHGTRIVS